MTHINELCGSVFCLAGLSLLVAGILADEAFSNSSVAGSLTKPVSAKLLYGESHGISWTDLAKGERLSPLLLEKDMTVFGLDYHYSKRLLFFSAHRSGIWRLQFDHLGAVGSPEEIVTGAEGVTSIAVDWIRDRLYWTTPKNGTVHRVQLDGSHKELVLNVTERAKLGNFNNVIIDPYSRFLFLATDGHGFIRTNINGGSIAFVQPKGLKDKRVVSLAIDRTLKRLYVSSVHDYVPHISSCGYDGSYTLDYDLSDAWWHKFVSIDVLGDQLFWVHSAWQNERDSAWKANMSSNGSLSWEKEYNAPETVLGDPRKIWNLKVYHSSVQSVNKGSDVTVGVERTLQESTAVSEPPFPVVLSSSHLSCQTSYFLLTLSFFVITLHSLFGKNC